VESFVVKLKDGDVKLSCKALGTSDETKEALSAAAKAIGISAFIEKADDSLLNSFCETLGLETSSREEMMKQIADEVMLTGMESFLHKLTAPLLKSHCSEMSISQSGTKKELIERLMVHIFELEPLDNEKTKKTKKTKGKSSKKEKSKNDNKDRKNENGKKEKQKQGTTREKFVAPPLETIRVGKYDTHVTLYDNFNLPDLVAFCKQNGIKASGKKKEVIKRILSYLHTGEVQQQKIKPKRKRESGDSGKAHKKKRVENKDTEKESLDGKDNSQQD